MTFSAIILQTKISMLKAIRLALTCQLFNPWPNQMSITMDGYMITGVPLEDCPMCPDLECVPLLVRTCCKMVEDKGLDIVGIYRVPGNSAAVNALTEQVLQDIRNQCCQLWLFLLVKNIFFFSNVLLSYHSVEISWFFYHSDFTWNQFWGF